MSLPKLCAIVAMDENGLIGRDNQLPWHLPADLKHFKTVTTGSPIIMGRKTYESIGRPLPNRTNIVVTRDSDYMAPGCIVVQTIDAAISQAAAHATDKVFIIGGSTIYQQTMAKLNYLYLTVVHHEFEGDTHLTGFNLRDWEEVSRIDHAADDANAWAYSFIEYARDPHQLPG